MKTATAANSCLLRAVAPHPRVEHGSAAALPADFGNFAIHVFTNEQDNREQVAIVHGDVFGGAVAKLLAAACELPTDAR